MTADDVRTVLSAFGYVVRLSPAYRQKLYVLGGGAKVYCDIGVKAAACVEHDRKCDEIARGRQ